MESLEKDLLDDMTNQKLQHLEYELHTTKELLFQVIESLKQTQRHLVKLGMTQNEISKRVSSWPYIVVASQDKDEDFE